MFLAALTLLREVQIKHEPMKVHIMLQNVHWLHLPCQNLITVEMVMQASNLCHFARSSNGCSTECRDT